MGLTVRGAAFLSLLFLVAAGRAEERPPLEWQGIIEVAVGGGERGPWRQNESRYNYVDDGTVAINARGETLVAWVDQARKDVFFRRTPVEGSAKNDEAVNVSRSPEVFSWLPRLALAPDLPQNVYVLWQEIIFSGGSHGGDILFARSTDGGGTFSEPINLSQSIGGDGKARITRDFWHNGSLDIVADRDGVVYAAWTEYDGPLWFSRSTDGGVSFSRPRRLAGSADENPARAPSLAVSPEGALYLAWTVGEDEAADIRFAVSRDRGSSFTKPALIARSNGYSEAPKLAVDREGTVHLAYAESEGGPFGRYHVRYTRSADGGQNFEESRRISEPLPKGASGAGFPALEVDDAGNVYVLCELFQPSNFRPRGLAFIVSQNRGETFSDPVLVPHSRGRAGGTNGSHQGLLMDKLAVSGEGRIAIVNSSLKQGESSRVWLITARMTEE